MRELLKGNEAIAEAALAGAQPVRPLLARRVFLQAARSLAELCRAPHR